jgi:aldehyde:ferredoxin oxidoreductase
MGAKTRKEGARHPEFNRRSPQMFRLRHLPSGLCDRKPIPDGPNQGHYLNEADIHLLLSWYYKARGWDDNGIPTRQTLERVGLPEVAADFQTKGLFPDA